MSAPSGRWRISLPTTVLVSPVRSLALHSPHVVTHPFAMYPPRARFHLDDMGDEPQHTRVGDEAWLLAQSHDRAGKVD